MAIKENIEAIKDELSTQEQFLEGMIKGERFFKKYKFLFIALITLGIIALIGFYTLKFVEQNRVENTNLAYSKILENSNDQNAIELLKKDAPSLYALVKFKEFQDKNDTSSIQTLLNENIDPVLKQIFSAYTGNASGEILGDYDTLLKGYRLLKDDKISEAKLEFSKIPQDSALISIVKNLQHYQGNKQ
ncbi:hypothetical protein [Campylobacter mucosalis]|uniref:hypothetical protein n=1 Tax=Campylobacter mucosalis TaxID=202 RepID=UPI00147042E6|nr:hypothetical protein [Campylobacter mucosalis]